MTMEGKLELLPLLLLLHCCRRTELKVELTHEAACSITVYTADLAHWWQWLQQTCATEGSLLCTQSLADFVVGARFESM